MGCAGKACGNCDTGYYQDSASQCRECPPGETHIKLLQTLAPFCAILLLVFLLMFLVVRWLELRRGTDSATLFAMKQAKEFCIWVRIGPVPCLPFGLPAAVTVQACLVAVFWFWQASLSAQIMATAVSSTSPGLPDFLQTFYGYFAFFNLARRPN